MRIDRLELTRYGRFTDRVLDFGAQTPGQPDLHIIHGPNEAGKSTLLSAWLDLLFGIGAQSPYNFLHSYDAMRIGAELSLPSGQQHLIRTKGLRNTLTDAAGQPLPESVLQAALGGLDRKACANMFALDAATMETGGESILSSQGDLGELLFSATAGLSDLSARLTGLRGEGDKFWKKRARSGRLKDLRAELDMIEAERRELDVQAPEFARRRSAAETARADRDRLLALSRAAAAKRDKANAMMAALPMLAEWREAGAALLALGQLPDAPAEWAARVAQLRRDDVALTTSARAIEQQIAQLQDALDALVPDDTALAHADAEGFDEDLKAQFLTARRDLPRRHDALAELETRLANLAHETGVAAESTGVSAATLNALDALAANHAVLAERLRSAKDEARQIAEALDAAGGALTDDGADPEVTALRTALDPLRKADLIARLDAAHIEVAEAAARRDAALAQLAPWTGDIAELRQLAVPPTEALPAWRQRLDAARAAHDDAARAALERKADAKRRAIERDALASALGDAAPETVARTRADRDAAWAEHRAALDPASADRFANTMAAHDKALETQLAHAAELGRLRALTVDALAADQHAEAAAQAAMQAEAALIAVRDKLAEAVSFMPVHDPADPLAGLGDWLAGRRQALDLAGAAEAAERNADRAQAEVDRTRAALANALGMQGDLPTLAAEAQSRLERVEAEVARQAERRRLTTELAQRQRAEAIALKALDDWAAALHGTVAETPLAEAPPDAARLRELLPMLREQSIAAQNASEMRHRIAAMTADEQRFTKAVDALADALSLQPGDPLTRYAAAVERLDKARRIKEQRDAVTRDLNKAQHQAKDVAATRAQLTADITEITQHLSAADLIEAEEVLARIARRDQLRRETDGLEQRLRETLGVTSMPEVEALLDDANPETLRETITQAEAEREDAETQLELARRTLFASEQALAAVSGDERVALLDARRKALVLTIEDEARSWLRQRAGVLATQQALDVYRATHRGGMMTRASDSFAAITGGAYSGLATQPADDGSERLIALAADGGAKSPKELSKGTRFQLYLALRIAGFHEWTLAHGPVPVIADDIMETFDDNRTRLALAALGDMSRSGQVIYLTHHRHVCELALEACPQAQIIEL